MNTNKLYEIYAQIKIEKKTKLWQQKYQNDKQKYSTCVTYQLYKKQHDNIIPLGRMNRSSVAQ